MPNGDGIEGKFEWQCMHAQDLRVSSLFRDQMSKYSAQEMRTLLWVPSLLLTLEVNPYTAETICEASCPFPINHSQRDGTTHFLQQHTNYQ